MSRTTSTLRATERGDQEPHLLEGISGDISVRTTIQDAYVGRTLVD